MSNRKQYTNRDGYFNLDREDKRIRLNISDEDIETDSIEEDPIELSELNKYLHNLDKFKYYPNFLKNLFKNLARKYAAIKCTIKNITHKKISLDDSITSGILPPQFKYQQKFINRFSDAEAVRILITQFLQTEKQELDIKLQKANEELANRYIELANLLEPIISNTKIINVDELRTEVTLDSLIEQEFCVMITKMELDKIKRALKQEKLLLKKEKLKKPAVITENELNNMKKELKKLKLSTSKSKNEQGKPITKKVGHSQKQPTQKPKQSANNKKGNTTKHSRKDGSTKNTVGKRQ